MFTLTNLVNGDLALDIGTIAKGGTKTGVKYITKNVREAAGKGQVSISPAVPTSLATSTLVNGIAAYAGSTIVDPTTAALSRANDATLAARLIRLENQVASLVAFVEEHIQPGEP